MSKTVATAIVNELVDLNLLPAGCHCYGSSDPVVARDKVAQVIEQVIDEESENV